MADAESTRRREPWPWLLASMLLAMIGGSLAFLGVALANPDPPLHADTWSVEPLVLETLRARQAAREAGWTLEVESRPQRGAVELSVRVRDAEGRPVRAERVWVRRERPAQAGGDERFSLVADGDVFAGRVPLPEGGLWMLTVRAERDERLLERRIPLRAEG